MAINPVCHIFEAVPEETFAIIFGHAVFLTEIGEGMPAVVRRMMLLYSNAWKECSHFFTEGTGCLGEQLSAALHPRGHHFLNGGMDRDNPGFSGPALISALEIPFRGIDLYFAVLLDSEPGQAHNPEHFGHVVLSGRIDGLEIVNGERNALLIVILLV